MVISNEESQRNSDFRRNDRLERLLHSLNDQLACAEEEALTHYAQEGDFPVVFVMGPLRSGTTLFMQWLAGSGLAAYPTNLLSRFYGAPVVGAQIQLLMTDPRFNFRNEILDFCSPVAFESENGKTRGALAPNEFWYFWRRFLPFGELDWMPDEELVRTVDRARLVSELTTLTRVFGKPFALKGMIVNYHIPFLDALFKKALFIQIKREPVANIASILAARRRQLGNENAWYSFRIPEYPELKALDPVSQAAGQLYYINKAVDAGMKTVDEARKLTVQYEDFCLRPETVYRQLLGKLAGYGCHADNDYRLPERFEMARTQADEARILEAYERFRNR
ncbi:MAG: sulfotransferase [Gammaproteobacteria bacterium]